MRAEYDEYRRTVSETFQELFGGCEKRKKRSVVYTGGNATDSTRGESKARASDFMKEYETRRQNEMSEVDIGIRGLTKAMEYLPEQQHELKREEGEKSRKRVELTNRVAPLVTKHWYRNVDRKFLHESGRVLTDLITEVEGEFGGFANTKNTLHETRLLS